MEEGATDEGDYKADNDERGGKKNALCQLLLAGGNIRADMKMSSCHLKLQRFNLTSTCQLGWLT